MYVREIRFRRRIGKLFLSALQMSIASLPSPAIEHARHRTPGDHRAGPTLDAPPSGSSQAAQCPSTPEPWPIAARQRWLARFGSMVEQHTGALLDLMHQEVAKPRFEAFSSDILPLLSAIRWHRSRLPRLLAPRRLSGKPAWMLGSSHQVVRLPIGRVAIIATWNYPVQLLGTQVVQALASGNQVHVKPSENAPLTQGLLLDLAARAGLPEGQMTVHPATRDAGRVMLEQGRFDHVVFTGSTAVGREVAAIAARFLIPTTLELSGRDSTLVLDDADPAIAARSIWNAVTMNAGQTCMAPRRALVHQQVYPRFLAALAPLAAGARPRRLMSQQAAARVFDLVRDAVERGGRSLSGILEPPLQHDPRTLRPLAIVDAPPDCALVEGDHFGPAIAVVPVTDLDHALSIHRRCDQHLATSVFTRSRAAVQRVTAASGCTVTVNDLIIPTVHPACSVAGVGASGWGPGRGEAGLLALTRAVHCAHTSTLVRLPPEPPPRAIARRLERLMRWWYA